jgi:RimJ/RimL family protein N-acetyltransferase
MLRRLGCVPEGLLRAACPLPGGFGDETIWSMLRADWLSNPLPAPRRGPVGDHSPEPAPSAAGADNQDPLPDWSKALPTLMGPTVTLREIDSQDGAALLQAIDPAEIEVCIEPPPTTIEMFQQYIAWARRQRARGRGVSFSIFANGRPDPIGMLQLRSRDQRFAVAESGIFLAPAARGTGACTEVLSLAVPFLFDTIGAHRLESRTSATNDTAIGSLRRLGAIKEACLRQSFRKDGEYLDDELWTLIARDWRARSQDFRP